MQYTQLGYDQLPAEGSTSDATEKCSRKSSIISYSLDGSVIRLCLLAIRYSTWPALMRWRLSFAAICV
jgi:hypothetical protein